MSKKNLSDEMLFFVYLLENAFAAIDGKLAMMQPAE